MFIVHLMVVFAIISNLLVEDDLAITLFSVMFSFESSFMAYKQMSFFLV